MRYFKLKNVDKIQLMSIDGKQRSASKPRIILIDLDFGTQYIAYYHLTAEERSQYQEINVQEFTLACVLAGIYEIF
jgi:hypothetical protein